jgi:hypothetical protein
MYGHAVIWNGTVLGILAAEVLLAILVLVLPIRANIRRSLI